MKLSKLQNLINECIMIQHDYPLNWEFGVDLKEVQEELDAVKLILPVVIRQSEQLKAFAEYIQERMWGDDGKDLSEFVDDFLSL